MAADREAARGMPKGLLILAGAELAWLGLLAWMAWRS